MRICKIEARLCITKGRVMLWTPSVQPCPCPGFATVWDGEFRQDFADVTADRARADKQRLRDLTVGLTFDNVAEHVAFAGGEDSGCQRWIDHAGRERTRSGLANGQRLADRIVKRQECSRRKSG